MSYQIEAHADNSVTLTVKHLKVTIKAESFTVANAAAHRLGEAVTLDNEIRKLRIAAVDLKDKMVDLAGNIGRVDADTRDLLAKLTKCL